MICVDVMFKYVISIFLVWFFSSVCAWRCSGWSCRSCIDTSWAGGGSVSESCRDGASLEGSYGHPCVVVNIILNQQIKSTYI